MHTMSELASLMAKALRPQVAERERFVSAFRRFAAWQKGYAVDGYDPREWRVDEHGYWIRWSDYGDRNSPYGWEIDHIVPRSLGGTGVIDNLRPLHWWANVHRPVSHTRRSFA